MKNEPVAEQVKTTEKQEVFQLRMPDEKRTALLRYMIIMFAVAFVLVLMSMVLQVRSSNTTISELHKSSTNALTRAESLQDTNRALSDRNEVLEREVAELQAALDEALARNNALQAENSTLTGAVEEKENLQTVCDALARVLMGPLKEGDVPHSRAVDTVNQMKEYLSPEVARDFDKWLKENQ